MRFFHKIFEGIDTIPLMQQISMHPELWNLYDWRQKFPDSPHKDVDNILLRFTDPDRVADVDSPSDEEHDLIRPVWLGASQILYEAKPIVLTLMRRVNGYSLERLMITRLAPGRRITAHRDVKGRYAGTDDGCRLHIVLQGYPGSIFRAAEETVCMKTGEAWWFDFRQEHEVINNSIDDRIHLIADVRVC